MEQGRECTGVPQMCHNTSWNIIECRYYLESSNLNVLPTGAFLYLSLKIALNALYLCTLLLLFASNHECTKREGQLAKYIPLFIIFIDKCVLCHISRGAFGTINKIFTSFYSGENGPWLSRQPPPLVSQWVCWTWSNTRSKWRNKLMEKVLATANIHWRL